MRMPPTVADIKKANGKDRQAILLAQPSVRAQLDEPISDEVNDPISINDPIDVNVTNDTLSVEISR